jgi:hypothetical protein
MAVPTPKKFVQELPPAGGFPSVTYRKFPLQRGPAGVWIVVGTTLLTGFGIYQACLDNQERKYVRHCVFCVCCVAISARIGIWSCVVAVLYCIL